MVPRLVNNIKSPYALNRIWRPSNETALGIDRFVRYNLHARLVATT
jgi:hypothetical protein